MGNTQESNGCLVAWSSSDTDSSKSCVFIDEAGINISMKSSRAWAPRRQMVVSHQKQKRFWAVKKKNPEVVPREEGTKSTNADHCLRFLKKVLDIMDKHDQMKGSYHNIDNVPTHTSNQIEEFWALVKGKVKRPKLEDTEILQNRTIDAANEFSIQHLQNII
ncbi:hypothetical protein G6F46_009430 [Rhizopus delemar]|uniref:Tc1-like transposase DDE domain-containing protein n=2 Tax=Rhizopus TaxID=4842 RepID=A0A9P6Z4T0_9FUNG|nr:hypothetical protein G6F55_007062 [Rhizopus delemar]KAG1546776.1 hypothetical protein G6F51_004671 [Rhizopus arrhizus]KAG1493742.1 hypothetical protein G6F54_008364 [Rhizopus delemar]KAG1511929.1 hypothetical protein G6F53_005572 [Rhizopus delemar]KAG1523140.1 hypothetical protein G6F52_005264 [Rhizopus delemar]